MCGIIGYVGKREAAPILMEGLHRLEYRGYDSVGLAVIPKANCWWPERKARSMKAWPICSKQNR